MPQADLCRRAARMATDCGAKHAHPRNELIKAVSCSATRWRFEVMRTQLLHRPGAPFLLGTRDRPSVNTAIMRSTQNRDCWFEGRLGCSERSVQVQRRIAQVVDHRFIHAGDGKNPASRGRTATDGRLRVGCRIGAPAPPSLLRASPGQAYPAGIDQHIIISGARTIGGGIRTGAALDHADCKPSAGVARTYARRRAQ